MKNFLIICLIVIASGCKKGTSNSVIEGEYEWKYSFKKIGDSHSFESTNDKYGIRIEDGSLYYFKNGKKVFKKKITYIGSMYSTGMNFQCTEKSVSKTFTFKDQVLYSQDYPFEGYKNEFNKTK